MTNVYNTIAFILGSLWRGLDSVSIPFMPSFTLGDFLLFPLLFGVVFGAIKSIISASSHLYNRSTNRNNQYKARNNKNNGG